MSNDFELFSDLHKDARGTRPSPAFINAFMAKTADEQQTQWDALCGELSEREKAQKSDEATALAVFEARITGMANDYTISRANAMRWDMDGFGVDIENALQNHGSAVQEIEHYLWSNGIAFDDMPYFVEFANEAFGLTPNSTKE